MVAPISRQRVFAAFIPAAALNGAGQGSAAPQPRMHFADAISGRPLSKDPAVVKFQGNNDNGRTWYPSMVPVEWRAGRPVLVPRETQASSHSR